MEFTWLGYSQGKLESVFSSFLFSHSASPLLFNVQSIDRICSWTQTVPTLRLASELRSSCWSRRISAVDPFRERTECERMGRVGWELQLVKDER